MDIEKLCGLQFKGLTFEAVLFLKYWKFSLPPNTVVVVVVVFYNLKRLKHQCFESEVLDVHAYICICVRAPQVILSFWCHSSFHFQQMKIGHMFCVLLAVFPSFISPHLPCKASVVLLWSAFAIWLTSIVNTCCISYSANFITI